MNENTNATALTETLKIGTLNPATGQHGMMEFRDLDHMLETFAIMFAKRAGMTEQEARESYRRTAIEQ